jgi:energy-coupling factor transporter ATP-binding protein EcfA2
VAEIVLKDITKRYRDGTEAVKQMNLTIEDGEFVILVGPSGCGKTTALRMIAGLEDISSGELRIDDRVVNDLPPRDRERVQVRSFRKHLDQGGNLGRDGTLAPDENRRSDIEFRWQGMNTQQLHVGESLEDDAWDHRDPHACHRTAEYRVIRGGLDDAI